MSIGPALPDGTLLLSYGDYGANTGPIDVLGYLPGTGMVPLLNDMDTEQIEGYRVLNDGWVWTTAVDPRNNGDAQLATNAPDGVWKFLTARIDGETPVHVYDIAQTSDGALYVCGSREPGVAMVWRSTDDGGTWAEILTGPNPSRFYAFGKAGDQLATTLLEGSTARAFVIDGVNSTEVEHVPMFTNTVWGEDIFVVSPGVQAYGADLTRDNVSGIETSNYAVLDRNAGRWLVIRQSGALWSSDRGTVGTLPGPFGTWSGCYVGDTIWLCDGTTIFRVDD